MDGAAAARQRTRARTRVDGRVGNIMATGQAAGKTSVTAKVTGKVTIRTCEALEEMQACFALQREVWRFSGAGADVRRGREDRWPGDWSFRREERREGR